MSTASSVRTVALIGIPYDEKSSFLRGAAEGPQKIREALACTSSNFWSETGIDTSTIIADRGDVSFEKSNPFSAIRDALCAALAAGHLPLVLGGDHSITYPVVDAIAAHQSNLTIVHFDAHPDLYDSFEGDRLSHACPFARIMEAGLAKRLVQVGIRSWNQHQREQAKRFGVEVIEARYWKGAIPEVQPPVYISLDLDVLEPALAPGISHYEPGGLNIREVMNAIHSIEAEIVGADIVELNPRRDINGITAMIASRFVKELSAKMSARSQ